MLELLVVMGVVGVVAVLAGRSLYRTLTGKNDGCGCGGSCRAGTDSRTGCKHHAKESP